MKTMRIPFLVVMTMLLSGAACAAGKSVGATYGTRDQLRECMALDEGLKSRELTLQANVLANNRLVDDNDAESGRLAQMKQSLDRTDKAAILKFNDAVLAHNQHVQASEHAVDDAEAASKAWHADKDDMDQKCGALTYRPADMEAMAKERRKASAVAVAASAP